MKILYLIPAIFLAGCLAQQALLQLRSKLHE